MDVNAQLARMLGVEALIIGVIALFKSAIPLALGLLVVGTTLLLFGCLRPSDSGPGSEEL